MKTIAIDFDGVIHKYSKGWHDGTCYDEAMDGAGIALFRLIKLYKIFIFTTRDVHQVQEWMTNNFLFDTEIIPNAEVFWNKKNVIGITNKKLAAVIYIDDRAYKFENWDKVLDEID